MYGDISLEAQIFVLVLAREGNFNRAAKQLNITQPALTRKINDIEKQLGVKLFKRSYHRLELTSAGRLFVPEAQASIQHAERAFELARQQAQIENGPLRLGYSAYVHSDLVPVLQRWQMQSGSSWHSLILESASTAELMERVLRGRLHAAFGILPVMDQQLWINPIAREPFCLCVPKNHRLAQKPQLSVKDMHKEVVFWIPRASHPGFFDRTVEYINALGARPNFHEVAAGIQAIEIVAHGFGMALLPRSYMRLSRTGVVFKLLTDLFLKIDTALFLREDQRNGPFQDHVQAMLSQLRSLQNNLQ